MKLNNYFPVILLGILIALLGVNIIFNLYDVTHLIVSTGHSNGHSNGINATSPINKPSNRPALPAVAHHNLFGESSLSSVTTTNSSINLKGINYSSANPLQSSAIISINGSDEDVFKVGETLPGGIILFKIDPNAVILINKGVNEKLILQWENINETAKNVEPEKKPSFPFGGQLNDINNFKSLIHLTPNYETGAINGE